MNDTDIESLASLSSELKELHQTIKSLNVLKKNSEDSIDISLIVSDRYGSPSEVELIYFNKHEVIKVLIDLFNQRINYLTSRISSIVNHTTPA